MTVDSIHGHGHIKQFLYRAENAKKSSLLIKLLLHYQPESCVIFCNTKRTCKEIATELFESGFKPLLLHGDMEQKERDQMLVRFTNHSSNLLIATDVAARGLDIENLAAVVNFDLSRDPEVYVHRIGRTGRAGKQGIALSLYTDKEEYRLNNISDYLCCSAIIQKSRRIDRLRLSSACSDGYFSH